jgi:hypothetical protein
MIKIRRSEKIKLFYTLNNPTISLIIGAIKSFTKGDFMFAFFILINLVKYLPSLFLFRKQRLLHRDLALYKNCGLNNSGEIIIFDFESVYYTRA